MGDTDRAWIEIDRENLVHNVRELKRLAGDGCALMPAVKANAYGHGDVLVSHILQDEGITNYCVASVDEAVRLRQSGIRGQILILGYTAADGFPELVAYGLTQTALDPGYARGLSRYGGIRVHAGVDTGMHRLGIPYERTDQIEKLWDLAGLEVTGVFSHLCVSDGLSKEEEHYTKEQIRRFRLVTEHLRCRGIHGFQTHIQGSYGLLNYAEYSFDLARPGIALYGCLSSGTDKVRAEICLRPVLSLKARVASVKELPAGEAAGYGLTYRADSARKIAIVSIGYADGLPRCLSNKGHALVKGRKVPIIGRICMDQLTLDVTDVPGVKTGDEAVFIGRSGKRTITAEETADTAGTITNEILSRLGGRLKRTAVQQQKRTKAA